MLEPEKVLLFAKRVEDAAVTVMEPPALNVVPLMVPRSPESSEVPILVVATTDPCAFVPRSALARLVIPRFVVVAEPCTMRFPVVVAPPLMVSPVVWVPAPMVVDA